MPPTTRSSRARPSGVGPAGSRAAPAPAVPPARYKHGILPALALSIAMLLPLGTAPCPVEGVWPAIRVEEGTRKALLDSIARQFLAPDLLAACTEGACGDLFLGLGHTCCLKAKRGTRTFHVCEGSLPDWLRHATWNKKHDGRCQFRLRAPSCVDLSVEQVEQQHRPLAESLVARFQGEGKGVAQRRKEMLACLGSWDSVRPWHAVHRLLCWDKHGPPPRGSGKSAEGMLLQGDEGCNLACHSGCRGGESAACLTAAHLTWGNSKHNARHREVSRQARKDMHTNNFRKRGRSLRK